ncbi:MAG: hypothetical protein ACFFCY_00815 [Promethearchaeota archaeon]
MKEYIEFENGNIPLILSIPHGGSLECDSIPQRNTGVLGIDKGTIDLAKNLIKAINNIFINEGLGFKTPFYISSRVRRSKIDLNRSEHEAYDQNSFLAREIYNFYHNKINEWVFTNLEKYESCLLIDIHGFERDARPPGFRDVDIILGTNNLESFYSEPIKKRNWEKNIRGILIQKMLQLDVPIAPGHPRRKEYVLTGGYITTQYGASRIPKSRTIQIEFSDRLRLHDENLKQKVIKALAAIFFEDISSPNYLMR